MSRDQLFAAFAEGSYVMIPNKGKYPFVSGYIISIEREDGSGFSFNLKLRNKAGDVKVHIRCSK